MKNKNVRNRMIKNYLFTILLCTSVIFVFPVYGYRHLRDTVKEKEEKQQQKVEQLAENNHKPPEIAEGEAEGGNTEGGKTDESITPITPEPPVDEPEKIPTPSTGELCTEVKVAGPSEKTLMIGDSRTLGLQEYSQLENVVFFADSGASVYNIWDKELFVPGVGKSKLEKVLTGGTYGNVCIMLGINELGYNMDSTVKKYAAFIEEVKQYQPQAKIFVEANLHVTKSRSQRDEIFNNERINMFNNEIAKLADNRQVFFLDVNEIFDDGNGNLNDDYSTDNTHVYGKYYIAWGQWLVERLP